MIAFMTLFNIGVMIKISVKKMLLKCKKKKVENQITLCQFCGHRTCERCCTKMRAFANQTE